MLRPGTVQPGARQRMHQPGAARARGIRGTGQGRVSAVSSRCGPGTGQVSRARGSQHRPQHEAHCG